VTKLTEARVVLVSFWISAVGCIIAASFVPFPWLNGVTVLIPATFLMVPLWINCESCGVSYLFNEGTKGRDILGYSMMHWPKSACTHCSTARS